MHRILVIGDPATVELVHTEPGQLSVTSISADQLETALLLEGDRPHAVILDNGTNGSISILQKIAALDRHMAVMIVVQQNEVLALRQRIVFLPFSLGEVLVVSRDDREKLIGKIGEIAARTEKRRSYQKLQASLGNFKPTGIASAQIRESFLGHFMDEASTGAILLNEREEVIYLNKKARELLPSLKIAPPHTFFSHFPDDYARELRASVNKPYSIEPYSVNSLTGEEIFLKFKVSSHKDLQDSVYHIIIIYDVTDSVLQARFLEERIKEKNEFIAVLSHDLKNPLSGLVMSAQTLAESIEELDIEDVRKLARVIDNSSRELSKQFDQLVEWARARQEMFFKPEPLKLRGRVEDALKLVIEMARNKSITVQNIIGSNVVVFADPNMVRSIFQNLVTNAIKFTAENGTITLSSREVGKMEQITVQDNGVGMTTEVRRKLMENEITTTTGTRAEKGTGLGLQLVKEFIMHHKGQFQIRSEEGKGTAIVFTLQRHMQ